MKRLVLTLAIMVVFALGGMAQNIWKPINGTGILGAAPDGSIFAYGEYGTLSRSLDDGESWQTVLGQETGFIGHINSSCFAVSPEGRICVFNDNQQTVVYSDDGGDTWQQTTTISSCAMPDKAGLCVPTNDIMVVWAENGEISYTLDGGVTWEGWILDFLENSESVSDLLVNENGDVYVSVDYYIMNIVGIYHSTLSGIQNWELVAFEGISIKDMDFDPEGNVVACGYNADGSSVGFQHIPGFYLFDGTSLAIGDGGVVYTPHFTSHSAILSYSFSYDHGEHFTEIGEEIPLVDIAPGGENARLFKGADNHLYFDGGGEYWKSIRDADHIPSYDYYPLIEEANNRQKWNVVYILANDNYPNDYHTEIQSIRDNINLDGVDYKLVWTESVYDSKRIAGAVREEGRRVYYRKKTGEDYEAEVLLYNFNLTVGDTVAVNWMGQQLMVMEVSQVEVDGVMRRQLGLGEYSNGYPPSEVLEYWIEGVGSSYGFLNSGYENCMGSFVHLLCYHENGDLVWDNEVFEDCVMNSDGTLASFAPQGAEWYFHVLSQGPITEPPFSYINRTVSGVEEVQGHTCSVIDLYDYVYEEDDIVYWYNQANDAFTVLYDFNAEAGESWYCDIEECSFLVTVQSVDNVTWNNRTYRTQYVAGYYADNLDNVVFEGKIIDGIGYEKGLFFNWGSCGIICGADYEYMRCYLEDGELLYHEGDYDCDYVPGNQPQQPQFEWYYEIQNEDGSITYQYMYQAGDTIINDEPTHILVKINTLYDKGLRDEVTHEYVYERDGKLYWWNKTLEEFTVLYDYEAEVGDSWEIKVGTRTLDMHVDAVEEIEYEGRTYRMLRVSDPEDLFSGNIVCGIGHLTSFFPERLMDNGDGIRVEGMRCYWNEGGLVFKYGDEDCDAVYSEVHGIEEDGPSTGSGTAGTFTVYPNPTNGVLFVETRRATSLPDQTYRIANLMGQTVLSGNIIADNQQINVSSLPQGMYFITFAGETRKFVVR